MCIRDRADILGTNCLTAGAECDGDNVRPDSVNCDVIMLTPSCCFTAGAECDGDKVRTP